MLIYIIQIANILIGIILCDILPSQHSHNTDQNKIENSDNNMKSDGNELFYRKI